jgi:hypothetical protein
VLWCARLVHPTGWLGELAATGAHRLTMSAQVATAETEAHCDLDILRAYSASKVSRATDAERIASALDWLKMAGEVATDLRESNGSELSRELLARRLESRLKRATDALKELGK